jgi:prophage regulatory protein
MTDRLLKTREVMELLNVGRTTLWRWMAAGKFPRPIKIGDRGDNRWRQSEIDAWIPAKVQLKQPPETVQNSTVREGTVKVVDFTAK